ncbi:MAG: GNAT family N-acetyltransferase [Candidatus Thorarchaeota archaeon]
MEFKIRFACIEDHPDIFELAEATWEPADYIFDAFPEWIKDPNTISLVAADPMLDKVLGLVTMTINSDQGWIQGLRTHPEARRRGIATALVKQAIKEAEEIDQVRFIRMGTAAGQEITKKIARKFGFQLIGSFRGCFLRPEILQQLAREAPLELMQVRPDELDALLHILEEIPFLAERRLILEPFAVAPLNLTELERLSKLGSFWTTESRNLVLYFELELEDSGVSIGCTTVKKPMFQPKEFWAAFNKLIHDQLPKKYDLDNAKEIALFSNSDLESTFPGISQFLNKSRTESGLRCFEEIIFEKEI